MTSRRSSQRCRLPSPPSPPMANLPRPRDAAFSYRSLYGVSKSRGPAARPNFLRRRTARQITSGPICEQFCTGIRWAVVGAVATRAYMPERMTRDFDILVHHQDGDAALARLKEAGYQVASELSIPGHMLNAPDGTEIDLLLIPFPWIGRCFATGPTRPGRLPGLGPALSCPDENGDVTRPGSRRPLENARARRKAEDLARIRETVARYLPAAVDDLESLIYLGGLEMKGT